MTPSLIKVPGYEKVVKVTLTPEVDSIIAIHNTKRGPALGGVRFYPYINKEAALADVLNLAKAMTYKAALAGLKLGGGKAVIIGDPRKVKTTEVLYAFGEFVDSLQGEYITAKDVGVKLKDLDIISQKTSFVAGTTKRGSGDPSFMTAYGVFQGIKAAAFYLWKNSSLAHQRVIVQGLGGVGWEVARYLKKEGAVVLATDTDPLILKQAVEELSVNPLSLEGWKETQANIFSPCALGGIINRQTIPLLKKNGIQIIAGSANNQLLSEKDGLALQESKVLYAPDYVINAGGLINVACELKGYDADKARQMTEAIYQVLIEIFKRADQEKCPTNVIADEMAVERIHS